jgi:hypothetical protein
MEEIFSATAVTTNWLILVPSSLLILSRAVLRDPGRRSGMCWFSESQFHPFERFPRQQEFDPELSWNRLEIPLIERDQHISVPIHSCFQDHFVRRVAERGPPSKVRFHGLG